MTYIDELYQTPKVLAKVLEEQKEERLINASMLVFCGCGTSWYMAQQMAFLCRRNNRKAMAIEAVTLLEEGIPEFPDGTCCVFISRSGESAETVMAMKKIGQSSNVFTFYLGCTRNSSLALACQASRIMEYAKETIPLESFSFYAQFLCLVLCCGMPAAKDIPAQVERAFSLSEMIFSGYIRDMEIKRIICLGAPFYMPLLKEMMLKNGEITQISSEVWGILEFRHGPRTWASENCLITIVPGERTRKWDENVAKELAGYGCKVLWYADQPLDGTVFVRRTAQYGTAEDILSITGFQTGLASLIGRQIGVDAAGLKHLSYQVEEI